MTESMRRSYNQQQYDNTRRSYNQQYFDDEYTRRSYNQRYLDDEHARTYNQHFVQSDYYDQPPYFCDPHTPFCSCVYCYNPDNLNTNNTTIFEHRKPISQPTLNSPTKTPNLQKSSTFEETCTKFVQCFENWYDLQKDDVRQECKEIMEDWFNKKGDQQTIQESKSISHLADQSQILQEVDSTPNLDEHIRSDSFTPIAHFNSELINGETLVNAAEKTYELLEEDGMSISLLLGNSDSRNGVEMDKNSIVDFGKDVELDNKSTVVHGRLENAHHVFDIMLIRGRENVGHKVGVIMGKALKLFENMSEQEWSNKLVMARWFHKLNKDNIEYARLSDVGDRTQAAFTGSARRIAQVEKSEALLGQILHEFLQSEQVGGALKRLQSARAFGRGGETNIFARTSTLVKLMFYWTPSILPVYGFCEDKGLTFIGPPASAIRHIGEADVSFVEAFLGAQREAAVSICVNTLLLETYITKPRHIEVQIFGAVQVVQMVELMIVLIVDARGHYHKMRLRPNSAQSKAKVVHINEAQEKNTNEQEFGVCFAATTTIKMQASMRSYEALLGWLLKNINWILEDKYREKIGVIVMTRSGATVKFIKRELSIVERHRFVAKSKQQKSMPGTCFN